MTREQAINYLISSGFSEEQVSEVVRALTYEPTTKNDLGVDCIDRAQAQTEIEMNALRYTLAKERGGMGKVEWSDNLISIDDALDIIRKLPSVTPQPCEDAVSRQEVLDLIADYDLNMGQVVRGIHALPSVTPQEPKTGHWIEHEKSISTAFKHLRECSCCKCYFDWWMPRNSFCPNCGADMREVEE